MGTSFVHCNACGRLPIDKTIKYYVANCGHIICSKCLVNQEAKNKCMVCVKEVDFQKICQGMRGQKYFMDPTKMLEEIIVDYDKAVKAVETSAIENLKTQKRKIFETEDGPGVRRVRWADELNTSAPITSTPRFSAF
ncbi:RING-type domain-containing protein [Aphelenchoides besseyi]|nr:RING-type domain-containing protein [Aphelenchoides besseyi]